jgi:hypothetical protein
MKDGFCFNNYTRKHPPLVIPTRAVMALRPT